MWTISCWNKSSTSFVNPFFKSWIPSCLRKKYYEYTGIKWKKKLNLSNLTLDVSFFILDSEPSRKIFFSFFLYNFLFLGEERLKVLQSYFRWQILWISWGGVISSLGIYYFCLPKKTYYLPKLRMMCFDILKSSYEESNYLLFSNVYADY